MRRPARAPELAVVGYLKIPVRSRIWENDCMGFWRYWTVVSLQFGRLLLPRVEWFVVAVIGSAGSAVLLDATGLVPKGQIAQRIFIAAIPAMGIVVAYLIVHAARAPWMNHRKVHESLTNATSEIARLQSSGPVLVLIFSRVCRRSYAYLWARVRFSFKELFGSGCLRSRIQDHNW